MYRQGLMGGAAALVATALCLSPANAKGPTTLTNVYGGGAALVAPTMAQAFGCYGNISDLYFWAGNPLGTSPPTINDPTPFNYTGAPAQDCATTHYETSGNSTLNYLSANSGTGIKALYSHDLTRFGILPSGWVNPSNQIEVSETSLDATDASIWRNGGSGGHVGLTVVAPGQTAGSGQVPNPWEHYGNLVQIPIMIAPVAIAYSSVYEKVYNSGDGSITSYKLNIKFPRGDQSGGFRLDVATLCQIYNGQIKDWNDPALKKLNGAQSFEDPADPTPAKSWSVPLQIVGRFDSAGATGIFTRHLAAVCGSVTYTGGITNQYAEASTTLPASLQGAHYLKGTGDNSPPAGEVLGKFTLADGADGVAEYLGFTRVPTAGNPKIVQGRLGYDGTDLVLPAVLSTDENTYNLNTATLKNRAGKFIAPTTVSAIASFATQLPPQSDADGTYDPDVTANGLRVNPQDWVQPILKSSYLADPVAAAGYPFVGTANEITYTCFHNANTLNVMSGFTFWFDTAQLIRAKTGLLYTNGQAPLPAAWSKAIRETFLKPVAGTLPLNLQLNVAGKGACTASSIVGG